MGYRFDRRDDDPPGDVYLAGAFGLYGPIATADNETAMPGHMWFESDLFVTKLTGRTGTYALKADFFGRKKTIDVDREAMVVFEQQGNSEAWHLLEGGRTLVCKLVGARRHLLDERGRKVVVVRSGWTSQESQTFLSLSRVFRRTSWTAGEGETDVSAGNVLFVDSENLGPDLELVLAAIALTC